MTPYTEVMSGQAQLLDVRRQDEWDAEHVKEALHIPLDVLLRGEQSELLDRTKKIYIYCMAGGRADRATTYLKGQGFQAENIGGLSDWRRASSSV